MEDVAADPGFWIAVWGWVVWVLWWCLSIFWWVLLWLSGKSVGTSQEIKKKSDLKVNPQQYSRVRNALREDWQREFVDLINSMGGHETVDRVHMTALFTFFQALERGSQEAEVRSSRGMSRQEFDQLLEVMHREDGPATERDPDQLVAEGREPEPDPEPIPTKVRGKRVIEL